MQVTKTTIGEGNTRPIRLKQEIYTRYKEAK